MDLSFKPEHEAFRQEVRDFHDEELTDELREAEMTVGELRDRKWELVRMLKDMGHDFTATSEGMDVVLSAPPSMRF